MEVNPEELYKVGLVIGGVIVALLGTKAVSVRREANASRAHSSSSARLEQRDVEWRQSVDADIDKLKWEIYARDGALRAGDHGVRNDMNALLTQMERNVKAQIDDVRADLRDIKIDIKEYSKIAREGADGRG